MDTSYDLSPVTALLVVLGVVPRAVRTASSNYVPFRGFSDTFCPLKGKRAKGTTDWPSDWTRWMDSSIFVSELRELGTGEYCTPSRFENYLSPDSPITELTVLNGKTSSWPELNRSLM